MYSISTISATSGESINSVSVIDSNNDDVSVIYNNQVYEISNDFLNTYDNNEIIHEDDEEFDDDDDGLDEDDEEFDDDDDELEDENYILDDDDIDNCLESINASNEYLKFVKYLIKDKQFRFNNYLDESEDDIYVDDNDDDEVTDNDGYYIYASRTYKGSLYNGDEILIRFGQSYYIPLNQRSAYVLDDYYPDVIYLKDNQYSLDEMYLGWLKSEEKYESSLYTSGVDIPSTASVSNSSNLPPSFDLRKVNYQSNYVTSVKNQGNTSNCWAFASIAALESHILKSENKSYEFSTDLDYSENNLKNVMSSIGERGTTMPVNGGGLLQMPLAYFIRWSGPILESQDHYINDNAIEDYKASKHTQGVIFIPPRNSSLDNDKIKEAVYNYGGVVTSLYWNSSWPFELNQNYRYYGEPGDIWHAVCIIGWDDTYPKERFGLITNDMGDGAFLIKNSYGSTTSNPGYYYVSYFDPTFVRYSDKRLGGATGYAFTLVENNTNYGKNFNYSPLGANYWYITNSSYGKYRNQWTTKSNITLNACGVYVNDAVNCSISITINNQKVGGSNKKELNYGGFHTIPLTTTVEIKSGETFAVEVTLSSKARNILLPLESQDLTYFKATSNFKESEYYNGTEWIDINTVWKNTNFCIHAYTEYGNLTSTKIKADDLTMIYGENKFITAILYDSNNTPLKNKELIFSINGDEYNATTDNDGKASIQINEDMGTYKVIIQYFGDEEYEDCRKTVTLTIKSKTKVQNKINVQILELSDTKCGSGFTFKLMSSNNKPLKRVKVTVKIGHNKNIFNSNNKGKCTISKKYTKKPNKITVIYNGDEKYNKKTKSAYVYKDIKIKDFKKSCNYDDKIKLYTSVETLTVYFKISSKTIKLKFKNKKATFNVKKYGLKKGNSYKITFTTKSKLYHMKDTHSLKINK